MIDLIEQFIKDNKKDLIGSENRISGIKHEDLGHYQGVIDGQKKAYEKVLDEIKRLRRLS